MRVVRLLCALFLSTLFGSCSSPVSTQENIANPFGSLEGEYGFILNGKTFDSGTPSINQGTASVTPALYQGTNTIQLSVGLFFEFTDGTFGSIHVYVPLTGPHTKSMAISSYQQDSVGSALISYDSVGFNWYQSVGGTVTLTKFDTINNLVSGTFSFDASSPSNSNTVHITSGYFNDIPIGEGSYGQGNVSATVNDSAFSTDNVGREMLNGYLNRGRLHLWAYGETVQRGSFDIQGIPLTIGTYTIKGPQNYSDSTISFVYHGDSFQISTVDSRSVGQLTISALDIHNRRISGTFQFSGTDTLGNHVTIASGEINNMQWEPY